MKTTVEDALKALSRRVEEVAMTVELTYKDRDLLEDVVLRLTNLEQALHMNREHQTEVAKDLKADIRKIDYSVQDRVDQVSLTMDDKTVIVKSIKESVFQKILKKVGR